AGTGGPRMNQIDPRIHQVLDGELARESLPPELRRVVDRLESAAALLAAAVPPQGAGLETRVMAAVRRPAPSGDRVRRLLRWFATPQAVTLRIRPAWRTTSGARTPS